MDIESKAIKKDVIKSNNMVYVEGNYRFVSHKHKVATIGFKTKIVLIEYIDNIRFDKDVLVLMRNRYKEGNYEELYL